MRVVKATPAESESDTNLSPARQPWADATSMVRRSVARRGRAPFPAPVGVDPMPQRHRQGGRHLDRGYGRPPVHGFPRQQRPPHRLRASAPEARDRPADGCAAVHAAALHVGAGGRARAQARRDRARQSRQGAVHHRRVGRGRGRGQARACLNRPLQDAVVLGRLPRRRLWRGGGRRRGAVPRQRAWAADAGRRARRAVRQLPLPVRHGNA